MSVLVEKAIEAAGLMPIARARRSGDQKAARALAGCLDTADLMALGALADSIREEEVGDRVRVHLLSPTANQVIYQLNHGAVPSVEGTGLDLLRTVAIARISSEPGAAVRVDWGQIGIELAQVALSFGANELQGSIAKKSGLPIADDAVKKVKGAGEVSVQLLKKKELVAIIERVGRVVEIVAAANEPGAIDRRENGMEARNGAL